MPIIEIDVALNEPQHDIGNVKRFYITLTTLASYVYLLFCNREHACFVGKREGPQQLVNKEPHVQPPYSFGKYTHDNKSAILHCLTSLQFLLLPLSTTLIP